MSTKTWIKTTQKFLQNVYTLSYLAEITLKCAVGNEKAEGSQTPSECLGFAFLGNQPEVSALLYLEQI